MQSVRFVFRTICPPLIKTVRTICHPYGLSKADQSVQFVSVRFVHSPYDLSSVRFVCRPHFTAWYIEEPWQCYGVIKENTVHLWICPTLANHPLSPTHKASENIHCIHCTQLVNVHPIITRLPQVNNPLKGKISWHHDSAQESTGHLWDLS